MSKEIKASIIGYIRSGATVVEIMKLTNVTHLEIDLIIQKLKNERSKQRT